MMVRPGYVTKPLPLQNMKRKTKVWLFKYALDMVGCFLEGYTGKKKAKRMNTLHDKE